MTDDTVPYDGPLGSDGIQHSAEELLKIFWCINSAYSGPLVAGVAIIQEGKKSELALTELHWEHGTSEE